MRSRYISMRAVRFQFGVTLVELMISLTLGMMVVGAATSLLLSTKGSYTAQDDASQIQDTGNYAIESVSRAIRQAAYVNWQPGEAPVFSDDANIFGYDASLVTAAIAPTTSGVVNSSDALVVRFFGSGVGSKGDGTIVDCKGSGIPAASASSSGDVRGSSIFYVKKPDGDEEPELYCRVNGNTAPQAIARGVESFQVLYGVDTDGDSLPNKFVNATAIGDSDTAAWKTVVSVKIALLVRGSLATRADALNMVYDLFGQHYGDVYGSSDAGTRISEARLPASSRNRMRKVFTVTIQLRNQAAGSV